MIVAVGSQNPVKVQAVEKAFQKTFGKCKVVGVSVPSGVSETPMSFDESIKGAKTRARNAAKEIKGAKYSVGLEGGFEKTKEGTFLCGYAAIMDENKNWGIGGSARILIPEKIVAEVKKGRELGDVMDQVRGMKNSKQYDGAVGYFTNGLLPRAKCFETAIICALAPFLKEESYKTL